ETQRPLEAGPFTPHPHLSVKCRMLQSARTKSQAGRRRRKLACETVLQGPVARQADPDRPVVAFEQRAAIGNAQAHVGQLEGLFGAREHQRIERSEAELAIQISAVKARAREPHFGYRRKAE